MIPLNTQPRENEAEGDGSTLELQGVPFLTVQGEGPFAGKPAVFIRTAGCNMQCDHCDTDYTSDRRVWKASEIFNAVAALNCPQSMHGRALVVLTGGEPLRQPVGKLCRALTSSGYMVQIETNGTMYQEDLPFVSANLTIVCSPKAGQVNPRIAPYVHYYKYPVAAGMLDPNDGLPSLILGSVIRPARPVPNAYRSPVYLTPEDCGDPQKNLDNLKAAYESCMKFGYTLGCQLHKLIGVQ